MDSVGARLAGLRTERSACLIFLRRLVELQAQVDVLLAVASANCASPQRSASLCAATADPSVPLHVSPAHTRLLEGQRMRAAGLPFFMPAVAEAGQVPVYDSAPAVAAARWWTAHDPASPAQADGHVWTAGEDTALGLAVHRIAVAGLLEHALDAAGISMPASLQPLGSASTCTLPYAGPRAMLQYTPALPLEAVWSCAVQQQPALAKSSAAAASEGLRALVLRALTASDRDVAAFVLAADGGVGEREGEWHGEESGGGGDKKFGRGGRSSSRPRKRRRGSHVDGSDWAAAAGRARRGGFDWLRVACGGFMPPAAADLEPWQYQMRWIALRSRMRDVAWTAAEEADLLLAVSAVAPHVAAPPPAGSRRGSTTRGAGGGSVPVTADAPIDWPAALAIAGSSRPPWQACRWWAHSHDPHLLTGHLGAADAAVLTHAVTEAAAYHRALVAEAPAGAGRSYGLDHVALAQAVDWDHVMAHLPGRTESTLRDGLVDMAGDGGGVSDNRDPHSAAGFTAEEDARLHVLHAMLGEGDWGVQAAVWMPKRTPAALRSHWAGVVAADMSWQPFTEAEVRRVGCGNGVTLRPHRSQTRTVRPRPCRTTCY